MKPRIPGVTVLEACRPNFAKYFKKSDFGECSLCKPAYDNYHVFKRVVYELKEDIKFPATVSLFVRSRVCNSTLGDRRHECEENRCKNCSFINYFIKDVDLPKTKSKYSAEKTFTEEYGIDFLLDSMVEWCEHEGWC